MKPVATPLCAALAACAALVFPGAAAAQAGGQGRGQFALLERADANNDGRLTRAEAAEARAQMFTQLDTTADGALSEADRPAGAPRDRGGRMLQRADANNDGRVTREEFMNQPYPAFDRFDANGDQVLDEAELGRLRALAAARGG